MPNLHTIFEAQALFQRHINAHPEDIVDIEERINYILVMAYAAEDELHEAVAETGWKPWATSKHINIDGVKSELVDTFQFFMNLCFAVGMSADELQFLHTEKLKKNYARANEGYDGVSTKCPVCKRAYDDTFVNCYASRVDHDHQRLIKGYCAQTQQELE